MRLFIELAPVAMAMFDRDMRYLHASRRWSEDFRLGEGDLRGRLHYEVFPELPERWKEAHRRGLAGEVVRGEDDRFDRADGSVQWRNWEVRPWHDASGAVGGIVITGEETTRGKKAEEALRESEQRLKEFFDNAPGVLFVKDIEGRFTAINRQGAEVVGKPVEEIIGRTVADLVSQTEADAYSQNDREVMRTGRAIQFEERRMLSDGLHTFLSAKFPLRDADGNLSGVGGVSIDITAQRQTEQALRESEANLRGYFENVGVGAAQIDTRMRFVQVNDRLCEITGYSREELLGGMGPLDVTHPEDREMDRGKIARLFEGKGYDVEKRYVRKDGREVWVHVHASAILDAEGRFVRSAGLIEDITARKVAELELQRSRALLAKAEQLSNTGAWEWDLASDVWTVSDQWQAITGFAGSALSSEELTPLAHPDDRAAVARVLDELRSGVEINNMQLRIIRRGTGEVRTIQTFAELVRDAQGRAVKARGATQDITERKQAEAALRASEARLRLAQQVARVGAFDFDITTGVSTWTPELEALYGLEPGQFGRTEAAWVDLLHPEDRESTLALNQRAVQTGEPTEGEWRVQWPDGSIHWLFGRFQTVRDADGSPLRLTGVNLDITARKEAEAALREANGRYELVLQGTAAGIWDWDVPRGKVMFSRQWKAMRGFDEHEISDSEEEWSRRIHPEDRARVRSAVQAHFDGRTAFFAEEYRTRRKDGSWMWIADRGIARRDAGGRVVRMAGSEIDITARKELEIEVLRSSDAERRRMAADLHDGICQDLVAVTFVARGMQRQLQKDAHPLAMQVGAIADAVAKAAADTREIARGLDPVVAEGDGLMEALRELAVVTEQRQQIRCRFDCPSQVSIADPVVSGQLFRIAQEAVRNAVGHSGATQIVVALTDAGQEICLAITDDGCGLPPNPDRGTGLGLRGMRYRAGQIHGQLTVRNREQGGTEVLCRAPKPGEG